MPGSIGTMAGTAAAAAGAPSSSGTAVMLCGKEEKVLGVQKAPGSCPYCGGVVAATDVEAEWALCCLPLCRRTKRRFACTACARRLVTYPAILHD